MYEYGKLRGTAIRRNMKHNIIIIAIAVFMACLIVGAGLMLVGQFNPFTAGLAMGLVSVIVCAIISKVRHPPMPNSRHEQP
jgi:CHASE2 domain-containing sensor protein